MKLHYMKQSEIKILKEKLWLKNNRKCPLLNQEVKLDKMVLDHKHKLKNDECGPGRGTIREALEFRSNALAGKIENAFTRYFGSDESKQPITLPDFLRNMADYLERGDYIEDDTYFIHPNEVPKRQKINKSALNRIKKYYFLIFPKRRKLPDFTYMTEEVKDILNKIDNYIEEEKRIKDEKRKLRKLKKKESNG